MEELIGKTVKVVLNSSSGIYATTGKVVKVIDNFILLDNSNGPIYISLNVVKTIHICGETV